VFLDDSDLHPRVRERIELTRELIRPHAAVDERVSSVGETRTERMVSLVLLGDLVSLYMAILAGYDPGPVDVLEEIKRRLQPSGS
jgi:glucose/mannose-6-phosphate isomerase